MRWVRHVALLFRLCCKAPSKPTWDRGWEFAASPLGWGHCHYPDLLVLPPQGPPSVKTRLQEQSTVKRHFTEPVPQHQPAQPCPVIWASFMFPRGALETEIPSTRNFLNKDIGMVIQLRLGVFPSLQVARSILARAARCEMCSPSHLE